jgi:hypothetical protein
MRVLSSTVSKQHAMNMCRRNGGTVSRTLNLACGLKNIFNRLQAPTALPMGRHSLCPLSGRQCEHHSQPEHGYCSCHECCSNCEISGSHNDEYKTTTFCEMVLCSLVVDRRFRGAYCPIVRALVGHPPVYKAPYSRRLSSSYHQDVQSHRWPTLFCLKRR